MLLGLVPGEPVPFLKALLALGGGEDAWACAMCSVMPACVTTAAPSVCCAVQHTC
jgi:hypothetical protein